MHEEHSSKNHLCLSQRYTNDMKLLSEEFESRLPLPSGDKVLFRLIKDLFSSNPEELSSDLQLESIELVFHLVQK